MLRFYFNLSPNPMKVALFLAEAGLPYEPHPVDTRRGEQFGAEFLGINPNSKLPAIVDDGRTVFDSNAILLYLGEKTGRFVPADTGLRGELLSWLMFAATGIGPYFGQAVHFRHFAPEPVPYAHERYQFEADRHLRVLDDRLAGRDWIVGDDYSIVDMDVWGWTRMVPFVIGDGAWERFPNLKRHFDRISGRPAAAEVEAFRARHAAAFKAEMDQEARAHMFRHIGRAAA